jgi:Tfp pilus assembly protein PilF
MTYKNLQNYKESKKQLQNAVSLSPEIKEASLELGEVLYQLGEFQEALDVLTKAESENVRPGQTAYVKGLVLLEMNKNLEAVESLRKAGEASPELVQAANYQMGQAYLKEGKLEEAEARFQDVINDDPDTDMAEFSRNFLEKIKKKKEERRPFRIYAGIHHQYDDNVVLDPEDDSVTVAISTESDQLEVITLGLEYFPEIRGDFDISAHYSAYMSFHHDLTSFDVQTHTVAVDPSFKIDKNASAGIAVSGSMSWVDYEDYLNSVSISPTYTRLISKDHTLQVYLSYEKRNFRSVQDAGVEDRDSNMYGLNVNWYHFFDQEENVLVPFLEKFEQSSFAQNKGYINLLYKVSKDDTEGRNWENLGSKAVATLLVPLMEKFKLQDYKNTHTVYGIERKDIKYGFSSLLFYQFHERADIQLLYVYRQDDSNIAIYDYDRNVFSIGVEFRY